MTRTDYRQHLRGVVAASAAPYGYTLTLWTTGAIATHAQQTLPTALEALLLLAGAVAGFGAVGAYAFGSINGLLASACSSGWRPTARRFPTHGRVAGPDI